MGLLRDAAVLRKLGHFLAGLFPGLGAGWERFWESVARRLSGGRLARAWFGFRESRFGGGLAAVASRFWWANYRKDRVDLQRLNPEGAAVLAAGLSVAVLLCLTLPFAAAFPWPALVLPEERGTVAAWSALLVSAALAAARALILAGAATANRWVFVPAALLDLYVAFGLATASTQPRSWWTLPAAAPAVAALTVSEQMLGKPAAKDRAAGLVSAAIVGTACGEFYAVTLPPSAEVGTIKLAWGAAGGLVLGLVALLFARRRNEGTLSVSRLAGVLFVLELAAAAAAMNRAGLPAFAAKDLDLANLTGGLLWPLWYFAGVGIVFKLLGNTRAITEAMREFLHGRRLVVFVLGALVALNLLLWAPMLLDDPLAPRPEFVTDAAAVLYSLGRGAIWARPDIAAAAEIFRWVLLGELVYALAKLLCRQLDDALAATLLFVAVLGWLGAWEYVFERQGFLRSGRHTVLAFSAFGVWLLWLLQKVGMLLARGESPRWPASARLALFSGILVLVLAQMHARAAQLDHGYADEVFLTLYRACVDVGIPYALYVWAGRQVTLAATPAQLLGAFAAGALLTLPVNLLDRLALTHGDVGAMLAQAQLRGEALLAGHLDVLFTDPSPPYSWIALRGLIFLALAAWLGAMAERRRSGRADAQTGALALVLAGSAGFASFTRSLMDLPLLPPSWIALLAPARHSLEVDAYVVGSYWLWTLPALAVAVSATITRNPARWALALIPGFALHLPGALLWPGEEAWLRSTGVLWTLGFAGAALFVGLISGAQRLAQPSPAEPRAALRLGAWITGSVLVATVLLLQFDAGRTETRPVEGLGTLAVPRCYEPLAAPAGSTAAFRERAAGLRASTILVAVQEQPPQGKRAVLEAALEKVRELPEFEPRPPGPAATAMRVPDALLVDFSFETTMPGGIAVPLLGTSLAIDSGSKTVLLTWIGPPGEYGGRRWDLARIVRESGGFR